MSIEESGHRFTVFDTYNIITFTYTLARLNLLKVLVLVSLYDQHDTTLNVCEDRAGVSYDVTLHPFHCAS